MSGTKNPKEILAHLRNTFESGKTKDVRFRIKQLQALQRMYEENTDKIAFALKADLKKSRTESVLMEVEMLLNDLRNILANIHDWISPEKPPKSLVNILDKVTILSEPYGVVLVMGAWNYPFQLTLVPVAGAIAAGNCVVIKPSEVSSNSAKLMSQLIPKYIDPDCYHVYLGGVEETTLLLKEQFDYIFYTGSSKVGKIVHKAAAEYLTPTTLELGGKSPVYLDQTANIEVATKRILWGKCANMGQTCVAPDYLLCSKDVEKNFIETAKKVLKEWYGEDPIKSPDLGRIINNANYERLVKMLDSGKAEIGGKSYASELFIEPTILSGVQHTSPIMQEEIFGPILPIVTVNSVIDVINFINKREKPLALYIFSKNKVDIDLLLNNTSSGGVGVNDTIMHLCVDVLPFGGVGNSGMGTYHGKFSFDTFSHKKSCLHKSFAAIGEKLAASRYPPSSDKKINFLKTLLKKRTGFPRSFGLLNYLLVFGLGIAFSYYLNRARKIY